MAKTIGEVIQVIGPVVDVSFPGIKESLPQIHDALEIERPGQSKLIIECQQHIGENAVRCIAMDSTDGLTRGMEVEATGSPIMMPKGDNVKGRLLNVIGKSIDGLADPTKEGGSPIHKPAPKFEELQTSAEVLFTGIKVIILYQQIQDFLSPFSIV